MAISKSKVQELRSQAHVLNPVVMLGSKGYTQAVQAEIERALFDHELIKIRLAGLEKQERKQLIAEICQLHNTTLIQALGHTVTLYRPNTK